LVKLQKAPFTNSFVIIFPEEKDAETVYWLAYSLWKSNFWHQFLIGFVIPFLRINDFKKDFDFKVNEMMQEHELHKKQVQALRLLEQKEDQLHKKHCSEDLNFLRYKFTYFLGKNNNKPKPF